MIGLRQGRRIRIVLTLLFFVFLLVLAWIVISVYQLCFPKPRTLLQGKAPAAAWVEQQTLDSSGKPFSFWRFPAQSPKLRALICHGFFANRYQVQGVASRLAKANIEVLVMELRGHGKRRGPCTFGLRETEDALLILECSANQSGKLPVALIGFSMGGVVMCGVAGKYPGVGAVVADSLYSEFFPILVRGFWQERHIPKFPFCYLTWMGLQVALGCRLSRLDPLSTASQRMQPLLLIEGSEDRRVPRRFADSWFEQWAGPKERWCDPQAGHVGVFARQPVEYMDRVIGFFGRTFK